ncbi:MAG: metal-sensing transcriptional repressor [Chloroflexota bacterium]
MADHETRDERRKRTVNRIHRIKGQLEALERDVQTDVECEFLVTQASAIEKAMGSLILHMIEGYLEHHTRPLLQQDILQQDIDAVLDDIKRLFELAHRSNGG